MTTAASGEVAVRSLATGTEWREKVVVDERDLEEGVPLEDTARRIARLQADVAVETLEVDIS